ncbi:MAG: hypothetical protein RLZZ282_934 [Verrucomicrobiota bacterium]
MNSATNDRQLGEYHLKEIVSENPLTRTWLAEQVSVSRRVLVDELRAEQADHKDAFLADVRAKAAVEHPLVGSVYEAVAEPELCFFAYELLAGTTLEDRLKTGPPFQPAQLADVLRRLADAHLQHESLGQPTSPLDLHHVHLDNQGVIRLANLAIAGTRSPDQAARDISHLGERLCALVADGQAGSTRMLTLLGWMRGQGIETPLNWAQVRDVCLQIEQQLADPSPPAASSHSPTRPRKRRPLALIAIVVGLALFAGLGIALRLRSKLPPPPPRSRLPDALLIPAGNYATPDGTEEPLPAFRISAHEVTIDQYADFIETLETLTKNHRQRTFDHENQPSEKPTHQPDDWPAMMAAAKSNTSWNNHPVTLDSPVVGIDWWDAFAYCQWKQVRLATQEEWFAALRQNLAAPATIVPSDWLPVTTTTPDRSPTGLLGMAGSVCEWTRCPATNPANPLGERKWVIIGGSFLKPGSNALTREWTLDRSLRRPDLGFRVVSEAN